MKLNTSYLTLTTDRPVEEDAAKLRGYMGNMFSEYPMLHHHIKDGKCIYRYPRIQYKVYDGNPSILGIEEGAKILRKISGDFNDLLLGQNQYKINQKALFEQESEFGVTEGAIHYKFITPWLGLNSENYTKYRQIRNFKDKKYLLNSILIGNVLSMCKGLGIIVEGYLHSRSKIHEEFVEYKGITVIGFVGEFEINFKIPDFFGLGKGVSQGFGVIKSTK